MLLRPQSQVPVEPIVDERAALATERLAYRPVQYLGNKLRSLRALGEAASVLAEPSDRVCDLFSGTSVVSQEFARRGFAVTAIDAQAYAATFARATLGVERSKGETLSIGSLLARQEGEPPQNKLWEALAAKEEEALTGSEYLNLERLYAELPLWWKSKNALSQGPQSLLTTLLYAGTYFGVRQALEIDMLRWRIEQSRSIGTLTSWQYDAALTALCSAASLSVHSAGKHFAQPLSGGSSLNTTFLRQRLLEDRRVSVFKKFAEAASQLSQLPSLESDRHTAHCATAEAYIDSHRERVSLYYLDPPYTAQQYSRFYHFLETIVSWEWPNLLHKGRVTTGLYPTRRFKSAFSSKTKAPWAFDSLIAAARAEGAALSISYSQSSAESDGNARMISLEHLIDICKTHYGARAVSCERLGHRYRQFNSYVRSKTERNDPEVLILCKR